MDRVLLGLECVPGRSLTLPVGVNGQKVNMMIDTGAETCAIDVDTLRNLGLLRKVDYSVRPRLGGARETTLGIVELDLYLKQNVIVQYMFSVYPPGAPCLLGMNFMHDYDALLDFSRGLLSLSLTRMGGGSSSRPFAVETVIFGRSYFATLDSGYSETVQLRPSVVNPAERHQHIAESRMVPVATIKGTRYQQMDYLTDVDVTIPILGPHRQWRPKHVLVFEHPCCPAKVVLGYQFLKRCKIQMSVRRRFLSSPRPGNYPYSLRERQLKAKKNCRFC